jgi:glutathione S-transferase
MRGSNFRGIVRTDEYPHLLAWFERVRELPAWRNSEAVW